MIIQLLRCCKSRVIKLVFIDNPDFYFVVKEANRSLISLESPGYYLTTEEKYSLTDINQIRGRIQGWHDRIVEEITIFSYSPMETIDELREKLEENINNIQDPEIPFTADESKYLKKNLDDLVARMETLENDNLIHKGHLNQLQKDFDELKAKISTTPRKAWVRSAGHKFLNFLSQAAKEGITEGIKAIAEGTVKGLLLGGPQI